MARRSTLRLTPSGRPVAIDREPPRAGSIAPMPPPVGLGFLVNDIARLMRRRFIQLAKERELPLTRMEANVLLYVAREEGMSQTVLAQLLDIEPITLTRLVDRLAADLLVERRSHASDRRVRTIWLLPAGAAMLDEIRRVTLAVREEALAGFADAERQAIFDALALVRENLTCGPEEPSPMGEPCAPAESAT
jgi:DNA-binding MarR family transcriptional regulator